MRVDTVLGHVTRKWQEKIPEFWVSQCANVCVFLGVTGFKGSAGGNALQRLFSTFPSGWPGVALCLLRLSIGVTSVVQGAFYLLHGGTWTWGAVFSSLLLALGGVCLLVGFLTPYASVLIGIAILGSSISLLPTPAGNLLDGKLASFEMIVLATAMALLGPGAFSVDARLFGRREIVIPAPSRRPKS